MTRIAVRPVPDELSKAIIEQLQQDGRRAYATIGKAVGLSEAAVRQRVQKLVESGVMQIVAAGPFDVLAEIVVSDDEHLLELINNKIRAIPGVLRTETFLYLKLSKQTYNWGVR
jgi:Lrp/AsnC family transcriptional regulator, regulator for asnA, asnC and gidA